MRAWGFQWWSRGEGRSWVPRKLSEARLAHRDASYQEHWQVMITDKHSLKGLHRSWTHRRKRWRKGGEAASHSLFVCLCRKGSIWEIRQLEPWGTSHSHQARGGGEGSLLLIKLCLRPKDPQVFPLRVSHIKRCRETSTRTLKEQELPRLEMGYPRIGMASLLLETLRKRCWGTMQRTRQVVVQTSSRTGFVLK